MARLLRQAEKRAIDLLPAHRRHLDELAGPPMAQETVDGKVVLAILGAEPPPTPLRKPAEHSRVPNEPYRRRWLPRPAPTAWRASSPRALQLRPAVPGGWWEPGGVGAPPEVPCVRGPDY
ncbi:hypothetical protein [Kitasatospora sp. NPDC054795]